jgi:replicative DNA helicase
MAERIPNEDLLLMAKKEEPRFLHIMLRDRESLADAMDCGIDPEKHFWLDDNRFLFSLICQNYQKYGSLLTRSGMDVIMDMQSGINDAQKASKKMYWDTIYSNPDASTEDYGLLKNAIRGRDIQQQLYDALHENITRVVNSTSGQLEMAEELQKEIMGIEGMEDQSYCNIVSAEDGLTKAFDHITDRRDYPDKNAGVMSGIKGIDDIYMGFLPGSYTVVTGFINGGKTTMMFNLAFNMARAGYEVVYVSLEKDAVPMWTRLLSLHADSDYNRIRRGGVGEYGLSDYWYQKLKEARDDLLENIKPNLEIIEGPQGTKLSKVLALCDSLITRKKSEGKKIQVLVVDYLGVIEKEVSYPGRPDLELAHISQRLQAYGRIHGLVTITGLQLKNASTKDIRKKLEKAQEDNDYTGVEVNTEDFAGAQKVIADADNGMGVILNADKPPTKIIVSTPKSRDGQKGLQAVLDFDGRIGKISDPDLEPGQVTDVDDLIYNQEITADDLSSENDLFASVGEELEKEGVDLTVDEPVSMDELEGPSDLVKKMADNKSAAQELGDMLDPSSSHISDVIFSEEPEEPREPKEPESNKSNEYSDGLDFLNSEELQPKPKQKSDLSSVSVYTDSDFSKPESMLDFEEKDSK